MDCSLDSEHIEFQVYSLRNNRYYKMSNYLHYDEDTKAIAIPRVLKTAAFPPKTAKLKMQFQSCYCPECLDKADCVNHRADCLFDIFNKRQNFRLVQT